MLHTVDTAARQLADHRVAVDEVELPAEFEHFLDAQSDVLRFVLGNLRAALCSKRARGEKGKAKKQRQRCERD
jgi:hypothetical protein